MADPFRSNAKSQLLREARMGLTIVAVLLVVLVYVAAYKISGRGRSLPDRVLDAPIAQTPWPNDIDPQTTAQRIVEDNTETNQQPLIPRLDRDTPNQDQPTNSENRERGTSATLPRTTNGLLGTPASNKKTKTSPNRSPLAKSNSNPLKSIAIPTQPQNFAGSPSASKLPGWNQVNQPTKPPQKTTSAQDRKNSLSQKRADSRIVSPPQSAKKQADNFATRDAMQAGFNNELRKPNLVSAKPVPPTLPGKNEFVEKESSGNGFPLLPNNLKNSSLDASENKSTSTNAFPTRTLGPSPKNPQSFSKPESTLVDLHTSKPENTNGKVSTNDFRPNTTQSQGIAADANAKPVKVDSRSGLTSKSLMPDRKHPVSLPVVSVMQCPPNLDMNVETPSHTKPKRSDTRFPITKPVSAPAMIPARPVPFSTEVETPEPRGDGDKTSAIGSAVVTASSEDPIAQKDEKTQRLHYTVVTGDDYWSVAKKVYGDGRFFRALYHFNRHTHPDFENLVEGAMLRTPDRKDLIDLFPDMCPADVTHQPSPGNSEKPTEDRIYLTRAGDTLFDIARRELGQASRYLEIKMMNRFGLDSQTTHETPLRDGVRLVLPIE